MGKEETNPIEKNPEEKKASNKPAKNETVRTDDVKKESTVKSEIETVNTNTDDKSSPEGKKEKEIAEEKESDEPKNHEQSDKPDKIISDPEEKEPSPLDKKEDSKNKTDQNEKVSEQQIKPKTKAVILAPLEEKPKEVAENTKESESVKKVKEPEEAKKQKTAPKKAAELNKASDTNKSKAPKGEKTTNFTKSQDLKLPLFRRIHIKIRYIVATFIVILLALFFGRVALWEQDYLARMEGSERHTTATGETTGVGDDGEEVDTTEPTEVQIREYIVAPDKPRYFSIPSLGIYNARIVELGIKDNGELATPGNIYDMGWYTGSSLPGELGVSMIDGHGGDAGYGILRNLPRIAIGAIIKIEMGDGRIFNYRVVDTATKAIGDEANEYMATAFTLPDGVQSSLSMITCTGDYWQYSQTYSHRFFLRAALEN